MTSVRQIRLLTINLRAATLSPPREPLTSLRSPLFAKPSLDAATVPLLCGRRAALTGDP